MIKPKIFLLWYCAARSGFVIRNNIAHGVAVKLGDTLMYMRNQRWHGEVLLWKEEVTTPTIPSHIAMDKMLGHVVDFLQEEGKACA